MAVLEILKQLRELGVRVSASDNELLLKGPTARLDAGLVARIREHKAALIEALGQAAAAEAPIAPRSEAHRAGPAPLSFAQQRLWFLDRLATDQAVYNLADAVKLTGRLDLDALARTLNEVVARHESLRTVFPEVAGQPVQRVLPSLVLELPLIDLGDQPAAFAEEQVRDLAREEARLPFDLAQGPLVRMQVVRLAPEQHVLLFTLHHIISDEWSMGVLLDEVRSLYGAYAEGRPSPLPPLRLQYADFAAWQRERLGGDTLARQLAYWTEALKDAPPLLALPTDHPRPPVQGHAGDIVEFALPEPLLARLQQLARRRNATLFMLLHAAFAVLLSRWSGEGDICVGSPVANRNRPELEGLIGFFANTLVIRTRVSPHQPFEQLLQQVRGTALAAMSHQDLPFEHLVEALRPERHASHAPLVQAVLTLHNVPRREFELPGVRLEPLPGDHHVAKCDLALNVVEAEGVGLLGRLEYATDLFEADTVRGMAERFARLLAGIAEDPAAPVGELAWWLEGEREQLLAQGVGDAADAGAADDDVVRRFERQVQARPAHPAIVAGGQCLDYAGLNRRVNRLARWLRTQGIGAETRVAVCCERSVDAVVGLLAVLKAGGAYVPLDAGSPAPRLGRLLEAAAPALLLTQTALLAHLPATGLPRVCLDALPDEAASGPDHDLHLPLPAAQLAYVVFTSGSTGLPKGVAVSHANLLSSVDARLAYYPPCERHLLVLSLAFDGAASGLFGTLLAGGTLVIAGEAQARDTAALAALVQSQRIDLLVCVPSLYVELLRTQPAEAFHPVRRAIIGGEAWPPELRTLSLERCPHVELYNEYGPTEATIWATVDAVAPYESRPQVPIGRPVANTRAYVLDGRGQPVPPGVVGELYLGGLGVARGYQGDPALTAERFLPDPWGPAGTRMYRTQDRVRWLPDGRLDHLGRSDGQVKVQGYRIELGEVEAALAALPSVAEAAVAVHEGEAGRRLVGYVVAAPLASADPAALRAALGEQLPAHMVPARIIVLDAMPLTASGKLDRRRLPAADSADGSGGYQAPRTPVEAALADIWAEVLSLPRVGVHDDFFALGGHSLLATQVVTRVRSVLQVELPLLALFEAPTVEAFAQRIGEVPVPQAEPAAAVIPVVPRDAPLPLSFAQQRLWFLDQFESDSVTYNVSDALRLSGPLDVGALHRTLNRLVARHEVLRTTFVARDGQPVQCIAPVLELPLPLTDLAGLPAAAREARARELALQEARTRFDLGSGPLIRVQLLRLAPEEHVVLFTLHHIVSDGWSMGVLVREVAAFYGAESLGRPHGLAPLAVQYADFAHWQRRWLTGERLERQLAYWSSALDGAPPLLALPTDRPRPPVQTYRGSTCHFAIAPDLAAALQALARERQATLFMVLHAAFAALLARWSGQQDLCIGTPIANRTQAETEALIGFFVNTLVLRTQVDPAQPFEELLAQSRTRTLEAYAHQDLPFEVLVERLQPDREVAHSPLFQALLVLQNAPLEGLELPGLHLQGLGLQGTTSKFDLSLYVMPAHDQGLACYFEYNTDLFDPATLERLAGRLQRLLQGIAADPAQRIDALLLLHDEEGQPQRLAWNDTAAPFPDALCVHQLFEQQVRRTPDAPALVFEGRAQSYAALNAQANRLAHHLLDLGVQPDTRVAVALRRGPALVVALLAVLKAGGAYVPVDPEHPARRIASTLEDCAPLALLTESAVRPALGELPAGLPVLCLDDTAPPWRHQPATDLEPAGLGLAPHHLAYVIYTSGSTGQPKGAMNEHRAVVNRLHWMQGLLQLTPADRVLQKTPFAFDVSVWEFFLPLGCGAGLVLAEPGGHQDPLYLAQLIRRERVTTLHFVPSMLRVFLEQAPADACAGLRHVVCSGEELGVELQDRALAALTGGALYNLYGPTEAAVDVSWWRCACEPGRPRVPIGHPIANTRLYVLDAGLKPLPLGSAGEICIAGLAVGRGYLHRPELTAERFLDDPFVPGERLYRTGDLGRWRADGALEYLGRLDHQVKIRGLRIELGEIESRLLEFPGVGDAVVVARDDTQGDRQLVAYVVPGEDRRGDTSAPAATEHWRETFDQVYGDDSAAAGQAFNLSGWVSSYDQQPVPAAEMQEWVEQAVGRIAALQPQAVLEIGCGTGLLLHRLAPGCRRYHGTDISPVALAQLSSGLAALPPGACEVTLAQAEARAPAPSGPFDTVVLNSVLQYFPGADYLLEVIGQALQAVGDGPGALFLGDVRHAGLLAAFHTSVALHQAMPDTPLPELCERVAQGLQRETELLVDPAFFFSLPLRFPRIRRVEVLNKGRQADNEMTRFRYDVVLEVAPVDAPAAAPGAPPAGAEPAVAPSPPLAWQRWDEVVAGASDPLAWLQARLAASPATPLALRDIPDAGIARDVCLAAALQAPGAAAAERSDRVPLLGDVEPAKLPAGLDRRALAALCARHGLWLETAPASGAAGRFHAVIAAAPCMPDWHRLYPAPTRDLTRYASQPAASRRSFAVAALRHHLQLVLPDYMVPAHIVPLERLPLNANGKTDRGALPAPGPALQVRDGRPPAARTPAEEMLHGIWCEVLGLPQLGIHDNFFSLGGHSLLATRVVARVRQQFGVELPLRTLFEAPTVAGLARRIDAERTRQAGLEIPPLGPVAREGALPLSFAQQRLWFLAQLEADSAAYNMPAALRLHGALDLDALRQTVQALVARHEILRTTFHAEHGEAVQVVHPAGAIELPVTDLAALPPAEREARAQWLAQDDAATPFDLQRGPVIRLHLLRLAEDEHIVLLNLHHIVADGWSMGILVREVAALYGAFSQGQPVPLPPLALQYADYAHWQRRWLTPAVLAQQLAWWTEALRGAPTLLTLPTDRPRPAQQSHRGGVLPLALSAGLTAGLRELSRHSGCTLFMTLAAAFGVLLARHAGQDEVNIGAPIANRHQGETEPLIGMFVNTLVLRVRTAPALSFSELLQQVRATALGAYAHQDLPFEQLVDALNPVRTASHAPLHQVSFNLQNVPMGRMDLPGLRIEPVATHSATAKLDLSAHFFEQDGALAGAFEYNSDLFDAATIERLFEHYTVLLQAVVVDPGQRLADLPLAGPEERQQVLHGWNDTGGGRPRSDTFHARFEAAAAPHAGRVALQFDGGETLTYAELDARANRLAHHLRSLGVAPDTPVGICLERSNEMVVALLAVLKAGGAYVPLDPAHPAERLAWIVEDAQIPLVVTDSRCVAQLPYVMFQVLLDGDAEAIAAQPAEPPAPTAGPDHLAYLIYTSGSTGRPKGVMLSHHGLCNLADAQARLFGVQPGHKVLQFASFNFDASTWEVAMALTAGATLCLAPREQLLPGGPLEATLQRLEVEVATLPPVALAAFTTEELPHLRTLVVAGEACSAALAAKWAGRVRFFNAYGPTEATVCASSFECPPGLQAAPPIGRALPNTRLYVLDAALQPQPVGVPGELYIAGDGLARGYRGRADLTAERFLPDPYSGRPGERMYRSGDLARWRPDGQLEYLGRADQQLKIRGFRIEPGEIEAQLRACPGVRDALVLAREAAAGDVRLVAYVVPEEGTGAAGSAQTGHWQAAFDQVYAESGQAAEDPRFNIAGWNSSYDHQPLPRHEMQEWVEQTVERIQALAPRRVLEIGCGSGLLLHRLAPVCRHYHGTDISPVVLQQLAGDLAARPYPGCEVTLQAGEAAQLALPEGARWDTVVLNSVAQYFPGVDHLTQVVAKAVEAAGDGGRLFLGDIRHAGLLAAFHTSLALFQSAPGTPLAALQEAVVQRLGRETELLVDPAYFFALQRAWPQVRHVAVLAKGRDARNELSRFRYDVVLSLDPADAAAWAPAWQAWEATDGGGLAWFEARLSQPLAAPLALRDIPDLGLAEEVQVAQALCLHDGPASDVARGGPPAEGDLPGLRAAVPAAGVDRLALAALCARRGLHLQAAPATGGSGRFHAVISAEPLRVDWRELYPQDDAQEGTRVGMPAGRHSVQDAPRAAGHGEAQAPLQTVSQTLPQPAWQQALSRYANQPAAPERRFDTGALRQHLQQALPDYLVPAHLVPLARLPLTLNGKVDTAALPAFEGADEGGTRVAPRTSTEARLAAIWAEVLKVERVGVTDTFFDLGGHSLLAIQLMSRIGDTFGVKLALSSLFAAPTVAALAAQVDAQQPQRRLAVPLHSGGSGTPLFLVHPASGEVFCYADLVRALDGSRPVYGLQSPLVAGVELPADDLDTLCRACIAEMVALQPQGDFQLVGWSLGGTLAFRIAELLEQQGRTVRWLTLLDTQRVRPEDLAEDARSGERVTLAGTLQELLALPPDDPVLHKRPELGTAQRQLQAQVDATGLEAVVRALQQEPQEPSAGQALDRHLHAELLQHLRTRRHAYRLTLQFRPGVLQAPVHTLWAEQTLQQGADPDTWRAHTRRPEACFSHVLPGRHQDFVEGSNAAPIAALIDALAREAAAPAEAVS